MDLGDRFTLVRSPLDLRVFAAVDRAGPLTGRGTARLLEQRGHERVRSSLARLAVAGVLERQARGPILLYRVNEEHLATAPLRLLANLRAELIRRVKAEIEAWPLPPLHASLFGSAARGDGDTESDIDLLLVRGAIIDPDDVGWRSQVDALARHVLGLSGNHLAVVELAEADLEEIRRERPRVVEEIHRDGIALYGKPPRELFGRAA